MWQKLRWEWQKWRQRWVGRGRAWRAAGNSLVRLSCLRPMLSWGPHTPILPSSTAAPPFPGIKPAACTCTQAFKYNKNAHVQSGVLPPSIFGVPASQLITRQEPQKCEDCACPPAESPMPAGSPSRPLAPAQKPLPLGCGVQMGQTARQPPIHRSLPQPWLPLELLHTLPTLALPEVHPWKLNTLAGYAPLHHVIAFAKSKVENKVVQCLNFILLLG